MPQPITHEVWNHDFTHVPKDRDILLHWDDYDDFGGKLTAIGWWQEELDAFICELDYVPAKGPLAWCEVPADPRKA